MDKGDSGFNAKKLGQLLKNLVQEEKAWLLRELLADYWQQSLGFPQEEAMLGERWFMNRITRAVLPAQREAREKYLCIFLFLRYGGLRLAEIFELCREDINLQTGVIYVRGDFKRVVPLPLPVTERLTRLAQNGRVFEGAKPFFCDSSQLRRIFRLCAAELNIDRKKLTVKALRNLRFMELQKAGIHPNLVKHFFHGRQKSTPVFNNPDEILFKQIQKEIKMDKLLKTSARNVFRGKVASIEHRGLLVDVTLQTADGLEITSTITETSCKSLELEKGKAVNAIVKAPWVQIAPVGQPKANGNEINYYRGVVEEVRNDENATEILITLTQGTQLCSVFPHPATVGAGIKKGAQVEVEINALAVILMEG